MIIPSNMPWLQARQVVVDPDAEQCECLSGGAIAGIVLGSIAGVILIYWLIRMSMATSSSNKTVTTTRYEHPRRHSRSRRSSYYSHSPPSRRRKYRREVVDVERPAKIYVSNGV